MIIIWNVNENADNIYGISGINDDNNNYIYDSDTDW